MIGFEEIDFIRDHAAANGEYGAKETDIEEYGAVRGNFKAEKVVGIDDGCNSKDSGKGASDERSEAS